MRRVIQLAARVYPRAWRERYGDEFDALAEDVPPTLAQAYDVLARALTMQFADKQASLAWIAVFSALAALGSIVFNHAVPRPLVSWTIIEAQANQFPIRPVPAETLSLVASTRLDFITAVLLHDASLSQAIERFDLYPEERLRMPLTDVVDRMRQDLHVDILQKRTTLDPLRQAAQISFTYPDAAKAKAVLAFLTARAGEANQEGNAENDKQWRHHFGDAVPHWSGVGLAVLSAPTPQRVPPRPDFRVGAIGLLCGLAAGIAAAAFWRWPRRSLTLVGFACAGSLIAIGAGLLTGGSYTSASRIVLRAPAAPDGGPAILPSRVLDHLSHQAMSSEWLASLYIPSMPIHRLSFDAAMTQLRRGLKVTAWGPDIPADAGLDVSYTGPNPLEAQRIVSEMVGRITEEFQRDVRSRCRNLASAEVCAMQDERLSLALDVRKPPSKPEDPDYPFVALASLGAVGGFLFLALARRRFPRLLPAAA